MRLLSLRQSFTFELGAETYLNVGLVSGAHRYKYGIKYKNFQLDLNLFQEPTCV